MRVGVVVATYNGEKYIVEQLMSIVNQSYKPNEIVISDGKSSDETIRICHEILKNQEIQYKILTSEKPLTVTENFQKGLLHCDCDYVFFSDQDDVWLENKISDTLQYLVENSACMAFSNAFIVDEYLNQHNEISLWESVGYKQDEKIKVFRKEDSEFIDILLQHNIVTGMCMCISKELKKTVLPFSANTFHDGWIAFLAALKGKVVAIDEKYVLYRQHETNVVGSSTNIKRMLKNKNFYVSKSLKRQKLMDEIKERLKGEIDTKTIKKIDCYLEFLEKRNKFLKRNEDFFYPLKNVFLYKKYEYGFKKIILKDYCARLLLWKKFLSH